MNKNVVEPPAGVLCIDKPAGMTSHDVVAIVRRIVGHKKVGHAGTLDPLATGVLLVCVGKATRISDYLQAGVKVYRTRMRLGSATTTYDAEGEVTYTAAVPELDAREVQEALQAFVGDIEQIPPMYSAIKQGGVPLHRLARQGIEVERRARRVRISELVLESWQPPEAILRVQCSSGTYVRSLVHDIGRHLGTYAHVRALRRLASGDWRIETAVPLATLQAEPEEWQRYLVTLPEISLGLPRLILSASQSRAFCFGQSQSLAGPVAGGEYQVMAPDGRCLGIGLFDPEKALLQPGKVFVDPNTLPAS